MPVRGAVSATRPLFRSALRGATVGMPSATVPMPSATRSPRGTRQPRLARYASQVPNTIVIPSIDAGYPKQYGG
jgi:hypothetical protein